MRTSYLFGYLSSTVIFSLLIWMCVIMWPSRYDNSTGLMPADNDREIYGITTGIVFGFLSAGLLLATHRLIKTLQRDFSTTLIQESATLKLLFVTFTISYLLRTFILLLQSYWFKLFEHFFEEPSDAYFSIDLFYFISLLAWDIVPLLLNFQMHHTSFKAHNAVEEKESEFDCVKTKRTSSTC